MNVPLRDRLTDTIIYLILLIFVGLKKMLEWYVKAGPSACFTNCKKSGRRSSHGKEK